MLIFNILDLFHNFLIQRFIFHFFFVWTLCGNRLFRLFEVETINEFIL